MNSTRHLDNHRPDRPTVEQLQKLLDAACHHMEECKDSFGCPVIAYVPTPLRDYWGARRPELRKKSDVNSLGAVKCTK